MIGEQLTEEYAKLNPQKTIPVLNDNGFILADSHAISTYLIGKYGKDDNLYPKDLVTRARIDQRLHFDNGILFTRLRYFLEPIFILRKPSAPEETFKKIEEAYDILEIFLKKDLFMVGNKLTVADFCCVATASTLNFLHPMDKKKHANVLDWIERCSKLPFYYEFNQKGAEDLAKLYRDTVAANIALSQ